MCLTPDTRNIKFLKKVTSVGNFLLSPKNFFLKCPDKKFCKKKIYETILKIF